MSGMHHWFPKMDPFSPFPSDLTCFLEVERLAFFYEHFLMSKGHVRQSYLFPLKEYLEFYSFHASLQTRLTFPYTYNDKNVAQNPPDIWEILTLLECRARGQPLNKATLGMTPNPKTNKSIYSYSTCQSFQFYLCYLLKVILHPVNSVMRILIQSNKEKAFNSQWADFPAVSSITLLCQQ